MSTRKVHRAHAVADTKLTVLVNGKAGAAAVAKALPEGTRTSHIRVLHRCSPAVAAADFLLVFSSASRLDHVAECVSVANKAHRLAALLVENDVNTDSLPYLFYRSGLRTLRNTILHSDVDLPVRILEAWATGTQRDIIAHAVVVGDELVVRSCDFEEYSVSFDAFPALSRISQVDRKQFVFEEDGLLLFWPKYDIHLDLQDIRFANDPKQRHAARIRQVGDRRLIGAALKRLRENAGLRQSEIKGFSERHVRRLESGDPLTPEALDAFALSIGVDVDYLLEELSGIASSVEAATASTQSPKHADGAEVLSYPSSFRRKREGPMTRGVSEGLLLAADSANTPTIRTWQLDIPLKGSVRGTLEHDFREDELFFEINDVKGTGLSALKTAIGVWSSQVTECLVSHAFVPVVGEKVLLARRKGILPGDVSRLELRLVDES